jgi:hypothetical protein
MLQNRLSIVTTVIHSTRSVLPSRTSGGPEVKRLRDHRAAVRQPKVFRSHLSRHAEAARCGLDRTAGGELPTTRGRRRAREALLALDLPDLRSSKKKNGSVRSTHWHKSPDVLLLGVNILQGQYPINEVRNEVVGGCECPT